MSITPFFHVYHKYVFIMTNISKIKISGTSYNITDEKACKVVELTQAQYDELPTSAKTSNSLFVITDATAGDLSNYYTKSETSGATEISTALSSKADTATTYTKTETDNAITAATSTKQDTLVSGTNIKTINNQSILGEGNIEIQGGSGGSSYTGVSGITINENNEIYYNGITKTWLTDNHDDRYAVYWFQGDKAKVWINENNPKGRMSYLRSQFSFGVNQLNMSIVGFALGQNNSIYGFNAGGLCNGNTVNGNYSLGVNYQNKTNNSSEFASGQYNNSVSASTTFGDSGNTLFSVGNGTADNARHNAFEIRQNGDIYISKDGQDVKLQDQLGGGGSSYTAGDGIDITNDVISVTGKVDTSTYNTYTAATDTALASKQTTLTAGTGISIVDNVISATSGGSGSESCTVDSTTMFYSFINSYSNDALDMKVRYAVLDYSQNRTDIPNTSIYVNFRDINYNTYVSQNISLDYSTSSYTLGDISQAEYIDVTYDSTIDDFKIAVSTAHTSTVFVSSINFWDGNIKVPFYTISSGNPCTAIENDIPTVISELGNSMLKGLRQANISSQQDAISIDTNTFGGNGSSTKIRLDEIDGSNSTLKPDIYIGLGTSGWTEINLSQQCYVNSLKATKYRVTYNYSEFDASSMGLRLVLEYGGNESYGHVNFDETQQPSLQTEDVFSAATVDWNASTKELVITYPETIEWYGAQLPVNISEIHSNSCQFGQAITKLESYGEEKQALKPYVKETRAALSGKVDTSAITTAITSSSTDAQVPSAKAVYDMVGNINTILENI